MSGLELKIPPDVVWVAVAALMWPASTVGRAVPITAPLRFGLAGALIAAGIALIVAARIMLDQAHTTWHPAEPGCTSSLVTRGVYSVSRNPTYVGMLLVLIGWAVVLASQLALAASALFVLYLNRFQIKPEERTLAALLGDDYCRYASRVRRWV